MCDALIPACEDFSDWKHQYTTKGLEIANCLLKNSSAIKKKCPMCKQDPQNPSSECLKCMDGFCPEVSDMVECTKCIGKQPPTEQAFHKCANCHLMPIDPVKKNTSWMYAIIGIGIILLILAAIYFYSTK